MKMTVEELFQTPYHIIDILPAQVPMDGPGQFFNVEKWFMETDQLKAVKEKHIRLILKLNCYRDISLDEYGKINPLPEQIADAVMKRHVCILADNTMMVSESDETCLTVFNADEQLLSLLRTLATGEGLYMWRPENEL